MPRFPQQVHPDYATDRPAEQLLAADTRMGAVELLVRDLDAVLKFYHEGALLDVMEHTGDRATLGKNGVPSVQLVQVADLPPFDRRGAGLFHTALVYPTREELSAALFNIAQKFPRSYTGAGDHIFSEAFYFDDPEGNGVELYFDRPREQWEVEPNSKLYSQATLGLDPNAFLGENLNEHKLENATSTLGHVHLQVGDIDRARDFYAGALGFEITGEVGSALFVSAGGYHHHMALNVFQSRGAGPRAASYGLGRVDIDVPAEDDRLALAARLKDHQISTRDDGQTLEFNDPWNSLIRVKVG